jgi:hypothetical protein
MQVPKIATPVCMLSRAVWRVVLLCGSGAEGGEPAGPGGAHGVGDPHGRRPDPPISAAGGNDDEEDDKEEEVMMLYCIKQVTMRRRWRAMWIVDDEGFRRRERTMMTMTVTM